MQLLSFLASALLTWATTNVHALAPALLTTLQNDPDLSTFYKAIKGFPDLVNSASQLEALTIFAPTNAAFEALNQSSLEGVAIKSGDKQGILSILSYHLIGTVVRTSNINPAPFFSRTLLGPGSTIGDELSTLMPRGQYLGYKVEKGKHVVLSGLGKKCSIIKGDIKAGESLIIHKINCVLTLPASLSTTANAIGAHIFNKKLHSAGLANVFDYAPLSTIFIPTNAAFHAAPPATTDLTSVKLKSLLKNHILINSLQFTALLDFRSWHTWSGRDLVFRNDSGVLSLDGARITVSDLILKNGVAHVLNK